MLTAPISVPFPCQPEKVRRPWRRVTRCGSCRSDRMAARAAAICRNIPRCRQTRRRVFQVFDESRDPAIQPPQLARTCPGCPSRGPHRRDLCRSADNAPAPAAQYPNGMRLVHRERSRDVFIRWFRQLRNTPIHMETISNIDESPSKRVARLLQIMFRACQLLCGKRKVRCLGSLRPWGTLLWIGTS